MKSHFLIGTAVGLVLATAAFAQSPNSTNSQSGSPSQATGSSQSGQTDRSSGEERQNRSTTQGQKSSDEGQKSSAGSQSQRTGDEGQKSATGSQTQRSGDERGSSGSQTQKTSDQDQKSSASQAQKIGAEGQSSTGNQTQRTGDEGKGPSGSRTQGTHDEAQKSSTIGGQPERTGSGSETQRSAGTGTPNSATQQPSAQGTNNTMQSSNTTQSSTNANASININDQQRTRVTQSITRMNVQPLTNVNFSLSVGTAVPRDVRLQTLPDEVVQIVPQYRGYSFVVVRDEIVIVEPSTYKIVSVLPHSGGSAAAAPARSKVSFTDKDRDVVRRHVKTRTTERQTTGTGSNVVFRRGERLPTSVEVEEFPDTVYQEAPALREYRYIHRENRTYLVDPGERTVIEEID